MLILLALISLVEGSAFIPFQHAGGQCPWFPAPSDQLFDISPALPDGCIVDQAAHILRHGSRFPETGSFAGWVSLFNKIQNATFKARGSLTFLPTWVPPLDDPNNQATFLSGTGAGEAFALGVDLRNRYGFTKGGDGITVWSASQQRVVDTASFWLSGYLSKGHYPPTAQQSTIVSLPDSVTFTFANSLTASAACPNYNNNQTFANNFRAALRPPITARLNKMLDGLVLVDTDIGVMMDLCAFQTEIAGFSPFCDVFTESEWLEFEYSQDLQYFYGSGPGNNLAGTTAWPLIRALTDLFTAGPGVLPHNATGTFIPPPLVMGFTHDNDIPPLLAALDLLNETSLNPTRIDPFRKFRSSWIVPFRGTFAIERLSCSTERTPSTVSHTAGQAPATVPTEKFVRIKVNEAPIPIPLCRSGPGSSCSLSQFSTFVARRGEIVGDFVQRCGLSNVGNATSLVTFLTDPTNVNGSG